MNIRQATPDDLALLHEGAKEFYASSVGLLDDFHIERFVESWTGFIQGGNGVIFVAQEDGRIDAAIGGILFQNPNGYHIHATELFWFARKEARGTVGVRIFQKFEDWAKARGAKRIHMAELTDSMNGRVGEFYVRRGYRLVERGYLLRTV